MTVADIMTANPVTVNMDTELLLIKEVVDHVYFHRLPVKNRSDLTFVGIISAHDLLSALSHYIYTAAEIFRDKETLTKPAHQIMSHRIDTVTPTTDCNIAVQKLLDANISCLAVVSDNNVILGAFIWKGFLNNHLNRQLSVNISFARHNRSNH